MTGRASLDLLISDEAHVTAGRGTKRDARPLDDQFISAERRLFLTATPRLYAKRTAAAGDDDDVAPLSASMDDESLYGRVVYRLSHGDAVSAGVVAPLKLVFLNITEAYYRLVSESATLRERLAGEPVSQDAKLALAMFDCQQRYGVTTVFSFHSLNERARMFAEVARGVLGAAASAFGTQPFVVDRVHGRMSAGRRYDVLSPVDAPTLITNARVLTTGVDVPAVDMVVFADPKQSHIDILQAMARAARVVPGKECGYVFVPIGEDEDGPFTTAVEVMRASSRTTRSCARS